MDVAAFRAEYPVFERHAYLNTGSVGPVPRAAATAAQKAIARQADEGRAAKAQFDASTERAGELRARIAALIGAEPAHVALTGATTDGVNAVVGGLDLQPGDEVLTTDEEHPGVLAPLGFARRRRGIEVRVVPFDRIADEIHPPTRLVVCSHVSWQTGRVVDVDALAAAPVPVLLDGAQGIGAVPLDMGALGCDYYAGSGQKWLCGPIGSGYLFVRPERISELHPIVPGYGTVSDPLFALDCPPADGAARFDTGFPPSHHTEWALAALDVFERAGMADVQERAATLAAALAAELSARGAVVAPRGRTTLVSWEAADPEAESLRLLGEGFVLRNLPGTPYVRASIGGWTTDDEIERLAAAATSSS